MLHGFSKINEQIYFKNIGLIYLPVGTQRSTFFVQVDKEILKIRQIIISTRLSNELVKL